MMRRQASQKARRRVDSMPNVELSVVVNGMCDEVDDDDDSIISSSLTDDETGTTNTTGQQKKKKRK